MAREKITLEDITDLDLKLAKNDRAITAATEIRMLSPEERQQRLKTIQKNIQRGSASLFEERVLMRLLEPRGAERILAIQRHLPRVEQALKTRSASQHSAEVPSSETPPGVKKPSKTPVTQQQYPSELLDFLATQKPPTPPVTSTSAPTQQHSERLEPIQTPSGWTRRDQGIVAILIVLLGVMIGYRILSGTHTQGPFLTFDQQARQHNIMPEEPTVSTQQQAEFDTAMQLLRSGDFDEGKTQMLTFITRYPQSSLAESGYMVLADTYRQRQNNPDAALSYYQRLLEEFPQSSDKGLVQLKMGFTYEEMEDLPNAEAMYRLVIDQYGRQSRLGQLANQRLNALSALP